MEIGFGIIEAESHLVEPRLFQIANQVLRQGGSGGRDRAHAEPEPFAFAHQIQ